MTRSSSSFILHPSSLKRRASAFTLVELMVSVALALLLLVGINKVFKTTTDTVGTGYATSLAMRQRMAVDRTFDHAFASAVSPSEQPFILIHSQQQFAFMDRNDLNNDRDGDVTTVDLDGNGKEGETGVYGEIVRPANFGTRSHRIDTLSFFARDVENPFHRLTGDSQLTATTKTGLVSNEYSPEAYLWIGHLRLPDNTDNADPRHSNNGLAIPDSDANSAGRYFDPGQATFALNPNNFVAADWALGQEAILLKADPAANYIRPFGEVGAYLLSPLSKSTTANFSDLNSPDGHGGLWTIPNSRIDIAKTTISDYRTQLLEKLNTGTLSPTSPADPSNYTNYTSSVTESLDYRFNAKPWITKPADPSASNYLQILARETALTTPFMFRGCSQFMVEFAGDFVSQQNDPTNAAYGSVTAVKPDGVVDYYIDPNNVRHIRWYGFPRDVAGPVTSTNPTGGPDGKIQLNYDVVPVRDVAGAAFPFEKVVPSNSPQTDYLAKNALLPGASYICAWGPDQLDPTKDTQYMPPKMIRIVMQLTDPQGRLGEGPVSEFVYKFGQ